MSTSDASRLEFDRTYAVTERTDLKTEAELRAEINRLEWIIRASARADGKTAIVIALVPGPSGSDRDISVVVSGPAYKDSVLQKAARHAMALYLEVMRSVRTRAYDEAIARVKARGRALESRRG